ncbi:MAG TPA: TetR/AcrR family transcriptional regulator [Candidatus Wallbacteria bacterium]|nr:TetR/AcrR family transcriptional regulator [Candidatus Wallbacteria bacterium]
MSKKEEILDLALTLFAEEGYDNTGVQKIVDAADVKKPTLYHYFGSKEGLLDEMLEQYYTPFLEELLKISEYRGDIVLTLEKIIFHYLKFAKENLSFYKMVLNLSFAPEKSLTYNSIIKYAVAQHKIIGNMFIEAANHHGNMKGKSSMLTYTFIGIINSNISYYLYTKNDRDIDRDSARKLCQQFMYGIFS